jgi:hypothetical protein
MWPRSPDSLWIIVIVADHSTKTLNVFLETSCQNTSHLKVPKQPHVGRRQLLAKLLPTGYSHVLLMSIYK